MPFDEDEPIENEPNQEEPQPKRPGPILHTPRTSLDIPFKIIIPILLVILVGIGGYWYYNNKMAKRPQHPPVMVNMPVDTNQLQQQPAPQPTDSTAAVEQAPAQAPSKEKSSGKEIASAKKPKEKKEVVKSEPAMRAPEETSPKASLSTSGKYTIVLGSFKVKKNADDLLAKWKNAGYPAYLVSKGPWYRVSIGKYPTIEAAKKEAVGMHDALKDGYIVDIFE